MKKALALALGVMMLAGCSSRVADLTVASTKITISTQTISLKVRALKQKILLPS